MEFDNETKKKIVIPNHVGELVEYDLVAYLTIDEGNFVVYTDNKIAKDGYTNLFVNLVIDEDGELTFDEASDNDLQVVIKNLQERMI